MKSLITSAIAFATLSIAFTANAHGDGHAKALEDAVKARQGYYQMIAFNFGNIAAMLKGEKEYSAEEAKKFANNMKLISETDVSAMWPAGSDNEALKGKTRALKKIWDTFPEIGKNAEAFKTAIAALEAGAGDGKEALGPLVGAVGKTCKDCHDSFRAKSF